MSDSSAPTRPTGGNAGRVEVGGRRKFGYKAAETVLVTDGYMSRRDAQAVLTEAMADWGVQGQSDRDIEPVISKIAHALRQGTSSERNYSNVYFEHSGRQFDMEILRLAAGKKDTSENPIRVWARSYNSGELAVRTYDMLKDPENVQLREEAALDYGCSLDVVHVSFDYADALVKYENMRLTQVERFVIKTNTVNKVRTSRSTHIGGTEGGSVQDSGAHSAQVETAPTAQASSVSAGLGGGNQRVRAGFAPMK